LASINTVALHMAQLVLGWLTMLVRKQLICT